MRVVVTGLAVSSDPTWRALSKKVSPADVVTRSVR